MDWYLGANISQEVAAPIFTAIIIIIIIIIYCN